MQKQIKLSKKLENFKIQSILQAQIVCNGWFTSLYFS